MECLLTIPEAAEQLGMTERHIRRLCKQGGLRGAKKVRGVWMVPVRDERRFRLNLERKQEEAAALLKISIRKRDRAGERAAMVIEFERFAAGCIREGRTMQEATDIFCAQKGIAKSTFYLWRKKYREEGAAGLVDMRGVVQPEEQISKEAFAYFRDLFLDPRQLSVKVCHMLTEQENKSKGRGWTLPSLQAMRRYVNKNIPLAARVLYREGTKAYEAKCAPYVLIDEDSIAPGAVWVGDHHQCNCWIRHREKWVRPWVTAWQDMRSRAVVGWHISTAPNQTTILLAMKRGIETYGAPEMVKIDNGRDYDSEMWTGTTKEKRRAAKAGYIDERTVQGLYAWLGIGISFAIPYHPQSKRIERWFDTLDQQFCKLLPTYCGKDTQRKPEGLADYLSSGRALDEAYSLETFAGKFGEYVEIYNNTGHTGEGMNGRSPAQVMEAREVKRVVMKGSLDYLAKVWVRGKVGKNGLRVRGAFYGQYDMKINEQQGREVMAAYDPNDMSEVWVYDAETMILIGRAEQARRVPYSEESARVAMREKAKARRVMRDYVESGRVANMDLVDVAAKVEREKMQPKPEPKRPRIRAVGTPVDGQGKAHRQQENRQILKKAAGAEGISLGFADDHWSKLYQEQQETKKRESKLGLGWFND